MASIHLPLQRYTWKVGEIRTPRFSLDGVLNKLASDGSGANELLNGTPTAVEVTTTDLSITDVAVSTITLNVENEDVIAGRALTMKISGQVVANAPYEVTLTTTTDSGQTFVKKLIIDVEA